MAGQPYAPETYVVRPHDTLYSIAWRHDLDYRELARWNHLGPDYRIAVGQILTLRPGPAAPRPAAPLEPRPPPEPPRLAQGAPPAAPSTTGWVWPTASISAPRPVPGGGVLLLGRLGQPIRAACTGRVVYAGSGLRAYGNLIIIKHADNLLSAYAHTIEPSVHEGQEVRAGQQIARMGTAAHEIAALYFEIRQNGKPVDPFSYLPAYEANQR